MPPPEPIVTWLHVGDLHLSTVGAENHEAIRRIVGLANELPSGSLDFAVLPGDNADDGTPEQFSLVRDAMAPLQLALHVLPGDHDFKQGALDAFYGVLGADHLPMSTTVKGIRCLFLDVVSAGSGGPDFRLEEDQLAWAERELDAARAAGERVAVFMHTYPADLRAGAARLNALLARPEVLCVDMGHTHYNELTNDGRTIFMATRSTGQVEEGAVGFSVAAVDSGVVAWRFQPLDAGWPMVLITRPADHRLIIDPFSPDQLVRDCLRISAKVLSDRRVTRVSAALDDNLPFRLALDGRDAALWGATSQQHLDEGIHRLTVTADDAAGRAGGETIRFLVSRDGTYNTPDRHGDGSDRDAIDAWPEKGIGGGQLGPNRNGRKW